MSAICKNTRVLQKLILFGRCQWTCSGVVAVWRVNTTSKRDTRGLLTQAWGIVKNRESVFDGSCCCTSFAGCVTSSGQVEQRRHMSRKQPVVYKKELSFDYAGDLAKLPTLEPKDYVYKYRNLPEVENAPESVKKLVSLDFADGRTRRRHRTYDMFRHIDTHLDGAVDKEKLIARWTLEIRNQVKHCLVYRRDKVSKVQLIEKIAARKKQLKFIRKMDFERFHWLLHELRIRYTPFPLYYKKLTRRYLRKQAVRKQAHILWQSKMQAFKNSVEAEKATFYEEKQKTMDKIQKDLQELNIDENKVFDDFKRSLEPPKVLPVNKNYARILRKYDEAVASGKLIPKPQMSPVR